MPSTPAEAAAGWSARLDLRFEPHRGATRLVHNRHHGPLRLIRVLPQPDGRCDAVIVHPPGGLVGGDRLDLSLALAADARVLCTTPGAQKWYRTPGRAAQADTRITLGARAALEWLPQPAIAYDAAVVGQSIVFELAPGATLLGWECLVLGRAAMGERFERGALHQRVEVDFDGTPAWVEHTHANAHDRLFASPLGWGGRSVLCTVLAAVAPSSPPQRAMPDDTLRDAWREAVERACERDDARAVRLAGGVSLACPGLLAARLLADDAQVAMTVAHALWSLARPVLLGASSAPPRIWAT